MGKKAEGLNLIVFLVFILILFLPQWGETYGKKLEVTTEKARVYLKPNENSTVLEKLEKGKRVTLGCSTKIKKCWFYVYFSSESSEITRSGYMLDTSVKKLYQVTQVMTLKGEEPQQGKKQDSQFRQTYWGMSQKEVIEMEGAPHSQKRSGELDVITYKQRWMNRDCVLEYMFAKDKLAAAEYDFILSSSQENQLIQDYKSIKKILIQKHGTPLEEEIKGDDPSERQADPKEKAGVSEELKYRASWQTPKTEIFLHLYKKRGQVNLKIEYRGLQYKELARKAAQNSLLSLL